MKRRHFIKKTALGAIGLGFFYSWQVEPRWFEFVRVKMPIKNLPKELEGKTLMQISDTHIGNRFNYQYIINAFKEAQALNPDYVVYTGDFVQYDTEEQFGQLAEVLKHVVTGSVGTVGVLGNHDYGENWREVKVVNEILRQLKGAGVEMLRNEKTNVEGLTIIGIDDLWSRNFHPEKVMKDYDESKANIVLCHNPDACDKDVWNNYKGWILAGHTHGGQCKPPFLPPPILPVVNKKYIAGKIDLGDGRTLYINRALGHLRQIRFNVRPEITIFELSQSVT